MQPTPGWGTTPGNRGYYRLGPPTGRVGGESPSGRPGPGVRPISWLVWSRRTKATIGRGSARTARHRGTATRPPHLRVAAARNFPQWAQA